MKYLNLQERAGPEPGARARHRHREAPKLKPSGVSCIEERFITYKMHKLPLSLATNRNSCKPENNFKFQSHETS